MSGFGKHRNSKFGSYVWALLSCLVVSLTCLPARSQDPDVTDVHVVPRSLQENVPPPEQRLHPMFRSGVDLVLVPVSVTDGMDRTVTGLDKDNFAVYQDRKEQHVRNVSSDDVPISCGIVLDTSGSMSNKIDNARRAVREFLKTANPQDEFFLIAFANKPELLSGFTSNADDIDNRLLFTRANGETSLLDAIYLALDELRDASNPRKALLVISDGGDNHSRYTESEVKRAVEEADAQVFSVGFFDPYPSTLEERLGPELLDDISEVTGGHSYTVSNPNDLADVATKIGLQLRNEYLIAYKPEVKPHDGKWHTIRVKLHLPKGLPRLYVSAKTGFFAPFR
jgi:Ca-activated chloride channel homolog